MAISNIKCVNMVSTYQEMTMILGQYNTSIYLEDHQSYGTARLNKSSFCIKKMPVYVISVGTLIILEEKSLYTFEKFCIIKDFK